MVFSLFLPEGPVHVAVQRLLEKLSALACQSFSYVTWCPWPRRWVLTGLCQPFRFLIRSGTPVIRKKLKKRCATTL